MSVTFWFQGDTEIHEIFECCTDPECYFCGGTNRYVIKRDEHEVNFANENAAALLGTLGYPTNELCGSASPGGFTRRAIRALNLSQARRAHLRPASVETGKQGATIITMPLDDNGMCDRLAQLLKLGRAAQRRGEMVRWG